MTLRKARPVTYSSIDRSPKTRAMARRNRSKAKTWLLKDRGNARRSHAGSGRKELRSQKQNRHSPSIAFPSHKCSSPKMMHSQSPVHNKFFKNQTSHPLVRSLLPNSPPCWHMHTSSLKRSKAPPEAETPPEQMLCNECNARGVSESIQGYNDMSNI